MSFKTNVKTMTDAYKDIKKVNASAKIERAQAASMKAAAKASKLEAKGKLAMAKSATARTKARWAGVARSIGAMSASKAASDTSANVSTASLEAWNKAINMNADPADKTGESTVNNTTTSGTKLTDL